MKTLVVDDDQVSRRKMEIILRTFGTVESADSGAEAIELFRKAWEEWNPFDLITLDISMPVMSGKETLKRLRSLETEKGVAPGKRVQVMMVTCISDHDTVMVCKLDGCDDFVVKPFTRDLVVDKVRSMGFIPNTRNYE